MKKSKNISVPELLKMFWRDGFFAKGKELSEIAENLISQGYHAPSAQLGTALIRVVRPGGFLSRAKQNGKWKYIQKYPPTSRAGQQTELFVKYDFHPRINEVASKQFESSDFKGAILNAFIEVVDQVKKKTGNPKDKNGRDLDGDDLMNNVFGCDSIQVPIIKFNGLHNSLDKAEQRGLMYLFKGIVGIRDKKAHLNFVQNDPLKTIEYLSLASLLLRLLDENAPRLKK